MKYVLSLATNKKHAVYHTEAYPYVKRIWELKKEDIVKV